MSSFSSLLWFSSDCCQDCWLTQGPNRFLCSSTGQKYIYTGSADGRVYIFDLVRSRSMTRPKGCGQSDCCSLLGVILLQAFLSLSRHQERKGGHSLVTNMRCALVPVTVDRQAALSARLPQGASPRRELASYGTYAGLIVIWWPTSQVGVLTRGRCAEFPISKSLQTNICRLR